MAQTAVMIGGTGGMGLATARILGRDHRIVLACLDQGRINQAVSDLAELDIDAAGCICDITDRASVERLFEQAEEGGHHVRAVVHTAAGISPQMGTPKQDCPNKWHRHGSRHSPRLLTATVLHKISTSTDIHSYIRTSWAVPTFSPMI